MMKCVKWFIDGKVYPPRLRSTTYVLSSLLAVLTTVVPVLANGIRGEVLLENSEVRGIELTEYCPMMMLAVLLPLMNLAVYYLCLPQRTKLALYGVHAALYALSLTISICTAKSAISTASAFPVTFLSSGLCMPVTFAMNLWFPLFEAVLNCLDDLEKEERMVT